MKKLMSILLVLLMLTSVLASCGGNDETTTTEAPTTEAPTTEIPTTEAPTTEAPTTEIPTTEAPTTEAPTTEAPTTEAPTTEAPTTEAPAPEIPTPVQTWSSKTDIRDTWSGKTLNVACSTWYATGAPWAMPETFITEEDDAKFGAEIQQAILDRNEFIEKTYGVKVNWINATKASMQKALEEATLAKNINYDLAAPRMMNVQAIVAGGYVYDLANREFIDFNNTYYREESIKTYTAHGHTFFVTGGFSTLDMETASVLYFNKNLLPDEVTNDIYDMVRKGEWTFDKLYAYSEAAYSDDGDGINDIDGTRVSSIERYYNWFGINSVGINESTGEWELTINDDRVDEVVSAIVKSSGDSKIIFSGWGGEWGGYYSELYDDTLVFFNYVLYDADTMLYINDNVGVVPFPMLNREQGRYYVPCSMQYSVAMCIPKITQDRNMSEYFLDVLFWTGEEYVTKTYIDKKANAFNTDAEKEMITEYIIPNISYDAGEAVGWGRLIDIKGNSYDNVDQFYEAYEEKAPDALKTIEEWNKAWSSYVEEDPRPKPPVTEDHVHTHTEVVIPGKASTVSQTGLTEGLKCSDCGKILKYQSVIPALEIINGLKYRLNDDNASYSVTGFSYTDKNLIIPSYYNGLPVTRIEKGAFKNNKSILSVTIPSSVTYIGVDVFEGCTGISEVNLSEGLTYIGTHAFKGCTAIEEIKIPSSVLYTGVGVFLNCTSLKTVEISIGLKRINSHMFFNCSALTTVTVPDSVTEIGAYSFYNCESLKNAPIGNNVITIRNYAFEECDNITEIVVPDSVTHIGEYAFSFCKKLKILKIGKGVTQIGRYVCRYSSNLKYAEFSTNQNWYTDYNDGYGNRLSDRLVVTDPYTTARYLSGTLGNYNDKIWVRK